MIDITNGNLKMILGLMWTLILHFQIFETQSNSLQKEKKDSSAKENLMNWLKEYLGK
jgi:hypothetical protein